MKAGFVGGGALVAALLVILLLVAGFMGQIIERRLALTDPAAAAPAVNVAGMSDDGLLNGAERMILRRPSATGRHADLLNGLERYRVTTRMRAGWQERVGGY